MQYRILAKCVSLDALTTVYSHAC